MTGVVLDRFVRALDAFESVVAAVPRNRWEAPSPCEGWSAADLVGHVIGALLAIQARAAGRPVRKPPAHPQVLTGNDPLAAWRAARADTVAALEPAALARRVRLPWGDEMPLREFVERYPLEILVHAWDLAEATGQSVVLDPALVRDALETARQFASAGRAAGLLSPECAVAEDAGDVDRLLAIFGRNVNRA